jgi:hypothetical protein
MPPTRRTARKEEQIVPAGLHKARPPASPPDMRWPILPRDTQQRGRSNGAHGRMQPAHLRYAKARIGAFEHKNASCIRDVAQQFAPQKAQRCAAVLQQLGDALLIPRFDDICVQSQIGSLDVVGSMPTTLRYVSRYYGSFESGRLRDVDAM